MKPWAPALQGGGLAGQLEGTVAPRAEPHISLEEVDSDEVIVRIGATPASDADGPRLADEVLTAIASVTREGDTDERMAARRPHEENGAGDGEVRVDG